MDKSLLLNQTGLEMTDAIDKIADSKGQIVIIDGQGMLPSTFIHMCEAGIFTSDDAQEGLIATITNLIGGVNYRIRLIGVNHDVLANTDAGELEPSGTKAKTTWQFVDMPIQKVNLGLPYEEESSGYIRTNQTDNDLSESGLNEITISPDAPSNMHGYTSAVGLLNSMQEIYNSLPLWLQKAIKLVRKDCFISKISTNGYNYESFDSTGTMIYCEQDRYGSCIAAKLFCLSVAEVGLTHNSNGEDWFPLTAKIHDEDNDEYIDVNLEGYKYEYFEEEPMSNQSDSTKQSKRICYYNGSAWYYWLRSPNLGNSDDWAFVYINGSVINDYTNDNNGVAPAFCI